jgi:glycosyltransferase involved in cell wall biosynthesis
VKILFVDQTGQLGGGELSLLDLIRNLRHESSVALFTDGPFRRALDEIQIPVKVLSLGGFENVRRDSRAGAALSAVPQMLKLRSELASMARNFDVIYANSQKAFLISALARRSGQAVIWHLRDMLTADHFSPLMRRVAVLAGNTAATAVIANSQATLDSFVSAGGNASIATVVYNGIDPLPFEAVKSETVEQLRSELGLQGKFLAGIFGRLTPWKGQHVVIDAFASIPDAHLLIVGDALFGEQAYVEELHARVKVLGIEDRVHFVGFRKAIPAWMACTDLVIHSSTAAEPFGRVVVEAMLAGRPVIASRGGGVVEIIDDQVNGLLVALGSSQELAAAVLHLRLNPGFTRQLTDNARRKAQEVFSIESMVHGVQAVLTGALSRHS